MPKRKPKRAKSSIPARDGIRRAFPQTYSELREPFVGGGSTFFATPVTVRRWINDLNPHLIAVYAALKDRPEAFIAACRQLASDDPDVMRQHFDRLLWDDAANPALRYLVLNRWHCAWSIGSESSPLVQAEVAR